MKDVAGIAINVGGRENPYSCRRIVKITALIIVKIAEGYGGIGGIVYIDTIVSQITFHYGIQYDRTGKITVNPAT